MLPTPPQPGAAAAGDSVGDGDAAAGGEKEKFGEATEFINWEGRGAADLILPEIEENSDDDDDKYDDDVDDEDNDDDVKKGCHHCALL